MLILLINHSPIDYISDDAESVGESCSSHTTSLCQNQSTSVPEVKIELPDENRVYQWNEQVRYSISVSDAQDGESRFGEINPNEVLLEITYLGPGITENNDINRAIMSGDESSVEHAGLALIRKSNCFSCHLDKTTMVGPSFSDISNRYEPKKDVLQRLGEHIIEGSWGVWGSTEMPPHENISNEEAIEIAAYILNQGRKKNQWIFPGFEGVFRIIQKPLDADTGAYRLTASYSNHGTDGKPDSGNRGEHTILLTIE